jgi:hypothetical protein
VNIDAFLVSQEATLPPPSQEEYPPTQPITPPPSLCLRQRSVPLATRKLERSKEVGRWMSSEWQKVPLGVEEEEEEEETLVS